MKRRSAAELGSCPRKVVALGEEAVLADSGRTGEVAAGVGRMRSLAFLNSLRLCRDRPRPPAPYFSTSHEWIFSTLLELASGLLPFVRFARPLVCPFTKMVSRKKRYELQGQDAPTKRLCPSASRLRIARSSLRQAGGSLARFHGFPASIAVVSAR